MDKEISNFQVDINSQTAANKQAITESKQDEIQPAYQEKELESCADGVCTVKWKPVRHAA